MNRKLGFILLFAGAVPLAVLLLLFRTNPGPAPANPPPRYPATPPSAVLVAQLDALEAACRAEESQSWATELVAQRFEEVIVQLWDGLRQSTQPLEHLASFRFDTIEWGTFAPSRSLEHGIRHSVASLPARTRTFQEWNDLVTAAVQAGWRLDGSEWRHTGFIPAGEHGPRSQFSVEFHLENTATTRRAILRGRIEIDWHNADPSNPALPSPGRVRVTQLDVFERDGPPPFEKVVEEVIPPDRGFLFIDPLLLWDLDGDGLDEVVLAGLNRLYWNRGSGAFRELRLCPHLDTRLSTALLGDFDGDGQVDYLGAENTGLLLFHGDAAGGFTGHPIHQPLPELFNPFVMTAGDIDGDGDLDVWLAQYKVPLRHGQMPTPYFDANDGFPSYLLVNDGSGHFTDGTAAAGLAGRRFRRTYSASFCDFDGDGDLDLVNVSDFAGVDLHWNDGHGHFLDATGERLPERHLFGMAHAVADFDGDGRPDLFAVGMNSPAASRMDGLKLQRGGDPMRALMTHGNRTFLNRGERFVTAPFDAQIAASGWAWGVAAFDFDNDGDLDLYLANGHRSGRSVRDYEPEFWMHDIRIGKSESNPLHELYFDSKTGRSDAAGNSYGGHQRNVLYLNSATAGWNDVGWLMGVAMPQDSHAVAADDLDGDGKPDLLVLTEEYWPKRQYTLSVFRNRSEGGNWIAVRPGPHPGWMPGEPTEIRLHTPTGTQHRWILTGDGHRQQSAPVAHFGLGPNSIVDRIDVLQRNRLVWSVERPAHRTVVRPPTAVGKQPR